MSDARWRTSAVLRVAGVAAGLAFLILLAALCLGRHDDAAAWLVIGACTGGAACWMWRAGGTA